MKSFTDQKKSSSWIVYIALFASLFLFANNSYSLDLSNLTGKWVLNKSKVTSQSGDIASTIIFVFDNSSHMLTINFTTLQKDNNPVTHSQRCTVNGALGSRSPSRREFIDSYWDPDKQTLLTIETIEEYNKPITKVTKKNTLYTLTNNGKTLVIKTDEKLPRGSSAAVKERHDILVYNKY